MLFNLIHRPIPTDKKCVEAFKFQQDVAHRNGFRTTILLPVPALFDKATIEQVKAYSQDFGDELGVYFYNLNCREFKEKFNTLEFQYWLFSPEDKKKIADWAYELFAENFGYIPSAVGSYYFDVDSLAYIKKKYPVVECALATCFEEGANVFRGTNGYWHLFSEGGPWWPWIPSKNHIHAPARNSAQSLDVVALPHLVRDMLHSILHRDDCYASHPANLLRGKIYKDKGLAYDLNFIDQYIHQEKFNDGYSYYNMFVGPNWVASRHYYEEDVKISRDLYVKTLDYLGKKKKEGSVKDMTMTEFGRWFKANRKLDEPDQCYWKDILYGSRRSIYWIRTSGYRATIDPMAGSALTDLRPYAGQVKMPVGAGANELWNGSYPFVLNQYRKGGINYFGRTGVFSASILFKDKKYDLSFERTEIESLDPKKRSFSSPFSIETPEGPLKFEKTIRCSESGITVDIKLIKSPAGQPIEVTQYLTGVQGISGSGDYPEDIRGITLEAVNSKGKNRLPINYTSKMITIKKPLKLMADLPKLDLKLSLVPVNMCDSGKIADACLSGPMYQMALIKKIKPKEKMSVCLKIEKR